VLADTPFSQFTNHLGCSFGPSRAACNAVNYLWPGTRIRDNKNSPFLPIWVFGKESQGKKERVYEDTGPQWWVTWLVHLPTLLVWDWRQGPGTSSERRHLQDMIAGLPLLTLLVADAGYVGFDLMKSLIEARVDFLIRCGSNVRLLVDGTCQQIIIDGRVYLWPKNRRGQPPLELRLIELKRGGKRVHLLTTVLN